MVKNLKAHEANIVIYEYKPENSENFFVIDTSSLGNRQSKQRFWNITSLEEFHKLNKGYPIARGLYIVSRIPWALFAKSVILMAVLEAN